MEEIRLGDKVKMRKTHPCGSDEWTVIRIGADIKMKCLGSFGNSSASGPKSSISTTSPLFVLSSFGIDSDFFFLFVHQKMVTFH